MSSVTLVSKPGLTPASAYYVPKDWDQSWMRRFIGDQLKFADVRNAVGINGLNVSGNLSSGYAQIGFKPPVVVTETPTSGVTVIQAANDGVHDAEILVTTSTAGDAYYRATAFGVTNWSWGTQRSSGSWVLSHGVGLGTPIISVANSTNQVIIPSTGVSVLSVGGNPASGASPIASFMRSGGAGGYISVNDGTEEALFGCFPGGGFCGTFTAHEFDIRTANTARVTVNSTGNVVINSPSSGSPVTITTPTTADIAITVHTGVGLYVVNDAAVNGLVAVAMNSPGVNWGQVGLVSSQVWGLGSNNTIGSLANLALEWGNTGDAIYFPNAGTTASAANAFLNNASSPANQLLRSTSSIRYKTNVKDLEDSDMVLKLRPITYTSTSKFDDPATVFLGLIAEEVAAIDPRLVHFNEDKPESVQYERVTVHLLKYIQRLEQRLAAAGIK